MTRDEIMQSYDVDPETLNIRSPGKFEGEPVYAPFFWDLGLQGFATEDDGDTFWFRIEPGDVDLWPELAGVQWLALTEDSQGFVYSSTTDAPEGDETEGE